MVNLQIIPRSEFDRVLRSEIEEDRRLALFAAMCRLNTLVEVKKAGSGHLGSSFSVMDILAYLYLRVLNVREVGIDDPNRDIYFSSKGHDVPALYSILYALGIIPEEKLLSLRRLGGLDGHPEASIPGLEASTGSLGMGISKGRGMAWAKKYLKRAGRVYVVTGDGELEEGQIWEALQTNAHQGIDITVIVDHNKIQTDMPVKEVIDLKNLNEKFTAFGWHVERCDGHEFHQLREAFRTLSRVSGKPKVLIADTIKGRGVSFMEKISDMASRDGKYLWHSGAPGDADFLAGFNEILGQIKILASAAGISVPGLKKVSLEGKAGGTATKEYVASAYGQQLYEMAASHPEIVVLDADLSADCRLRDFQKTYADRFIENGIAEQDMVSMAGGMARQGLLPVINTFASFLAARANEQIYNNACEGSKIIYCAHFAGMIPAGPGKSHQSVRDIALFSSIPNMIVIQPANSEECRMALRFCVEEAKENCMLRLNIGPSPRRITLPQNYSFKEGEGASLRPGKDALIFAYGAVMLHEALLASELAQKAGFGLEVVNMPWLNRVHAQWLEGIIASHRHIYILEDHMRSGGLGDRMLAVMVAHDLLDHRKFHCFGLDELPACGTPMEVLQYHGLDGRSLIKRIFEEQGLRRDDVTGDAGDIFDDPEAAQ